MTIIIYDLNVKVIYSKKSDGDSHLKLIIVHNLNANICLKQ